MNQKGFGPVLIVFVIIVFLLGYLFYSGNLTFQGYSEESKIQKDLATQLNSQNISGFEISVRRISGNYAQGGAGVPPQGAAWMAVKEGNLWKVVWEGQNIPKCSEMEKYKIPQEFYGDYCY